MECIMDKKLKTFITTGRTKAYEYEKVPVDVEAGIDTTKKLLTDVRETKELAELRRAARIEALTDGAANANFALGFQEGVRFGRKRQALPANGETYQLGYAAGWAAKGRHVEREATGEPPRQYRKYDFSGMAPGDKMVVENSKAKNVYAAAYAWARRHAPGRRFRVRQTGFTDGSTESATATEIERVDNVHRKHPETKWSGGSWD